MADVFPVDTTAAGLADLSPIARLDVPLARLEVDLQIVVQRQTAERMRQMQVAAHQYDVNHLDTTSQHRLPGSYPVDYLHLGEAS